MVCIIKISVSCYEIDSVVLNAHKILIKFIRFYLKHLTTTVTSGPCHLGTRDLPIHDEADCITLVSIPY